MISGCFRARGAVALWRRAFGITRSMPIAQIDTEKIDTENSDPVRSAITPRVLRDLFSSVLF